MEDFSSALVEYGQELRSSHGSWGKLMSNEGFPLWIKISGLATTPPLSIPSNCSFHGRPLWLFCSRSVRAFIFPETLQPACLRMRLDPQTNRRWKRPVPAVHAQTRDL